MKKIFKIIGFLLCLMLALFATAGVLRFKYPDGISNTDIMYSQQKSSIDLLCLGSSRSFENINTQVLWDDKGIAAFDYGGSLQPLWSTYFYMQETLKTQTPSVMVVDVFTASLDYDYYETSKVIKNNFGLKPSFDKFASLQANVAQDDTEFADYLTEYPTYHGRYKDLSISDFTDDYGVANYRSGKGFTNVLTVAAIAKPDISNATGHSAITEKNEYWLRQIIALADENDIPLVFVVAPYPTVTVSQEEKFNTVAQIAKEENIPFYDGNQYVDAMGIDFNTDFAEDNSHLNWRGNVKYTRWLEEILACYDLPDRRGEAAYDSWEVMARDCRERAEDNEAAFSSSLTQQINSSIRDESFDHVLRITVLKGNIRDSSGFSAASAQLSKMGIETGSFAGDCVFVTQGNQLVWSSGDTDGEWHSNGWPNPIMVKVQNGEVSIAVGYRQFTAAKDAFTVVAYNEFTRRVILQNAYNSSDDFSVAVKVTS